MIGKRKDTMGDVKVSDWAYWGAQTRGLSTISDILVFVFRRISWHSCLVKLVQQGNMQLGY